MMIEELPAEEEMEVEGESSEESSPFFFTRKQFFDEFTSFMDFALDVVTHIFTQDNNGRNCKEAFSLLCLSSRLQH